MQPLDKLREYEPAKKAVGLFDEFKSFAFRGNVVDLAIGVIIGGAFGGLIKSLVDNIIMPAVSLVIPANESYQKWAITVGAKEVPYGKFLADVVNFLILAFALYIFIVKFLGWMMRTKETAPPPPTKQEELLAEIRDLLKQQVARPEATT